MAHQLHRSTTHHPRKFLGLLATVLLTGGCALLQDDLQPPAVNLVALSPESGSLSELRFRCRLRLDNPNDVALPIAGGELELTLAERVAARGKLDDDVTIPAFESREVDAIVSIDVMSAVSIISALADDPSAMLHYKVEGYVDVAITRLGRIRFADSGEFSLTGAGDLIGISL